MLFAFCRLLHAALRPSPGTRARLVLPPLPSPSLFLAPRPLPCPAAATFPPSCKTSRTFLGISLHSPCLSTSASTTTSATSSPPPRASTSGRTWQGHIWNLRSHRTKVHLRQSCRTRLGLQRQGLAVYLGPDEENDGHRQVLLCCNTKVPRRFRRVESPARRCRVHPRLAVRSFRLEAGSLRRRPHGRWPCKAR